MTPLRTGLALAITVGLFYALCALIWTLAPGPFLGFMNNLFHGMDFSSMVQPRPFTWTGFLTALFVLSTWSLFAGVIFAWLLNFRFGKDAAIPQAVRWDERSVFCFACRQV